jgi:hypothetical protein
LSNSAMLTPSPVRLGQPEKRLKYEATPSINQAGQQAGIQIPLDPEGIINPSHRRRILILLCFPLVFLLGVPFWSWSTSIERLSLPIDRIAALESAPVGRSAEVCPSVLKDRQRS